MPVYLKNSIRRKFPLSFLIILCFSLPGCAIFTIDTMKNTQLNQEKLPPTRTSTDIKNKVEQGKNVFIGIAASGGGARASNFTAAVLLELEKLGILQHATVISSVSGSSVTTAYYGLYGDNENLKHHWDAKSVRKELLKPIENKWTWRLFNPSTWPAYWTTNYTRSDMMIETLNNELYDDKRYSDFIKSNNLPRILINATSYTNGLPFVFSDEHFASKLNSSLATYPVANAVMASSAFPGVFANVTLNDFSVKENASISNNTQDYEHLLDGGPADNLGVMEILKVLNDSYPRETKPKQCLLIVIDAYPYNAQGKSVLEADTRGYGGHYIDPNFFDSTDVMLSQNRKYVMEKVIKNFDPTDVEFVSYIQDSLIQLSPEDKKHHKALNSIICSVWHLTFQNFYAHKFETEFANRNELNRLQLLYRIRRIVNLIPTRYQLVETEGYKPETVQDYLFKAANILIRDDKTGKNNEDGEGSDSEFVYKKICATLKDVLVKGECKRVNDESKKN